VIWFYGIYQSLYDEIPDVTFVEGFPTNYKDYAGSNTLFIIDDLMSECGSNKCMTELFTRGSHHLNLSVMFITQNFFFRGNQMREITLNSHYIILCKNRRDVMQIMNLGRQLFPYTSKFFRDAFLDATQEPYSYLLADLKSATPEDMRLRTKILCHETTIIYRPR
jgi:hypothetical protein